MQKMSKRSRTTEFVGMVMGALALAIIGWLGVVLVGLLAKGFWLGFMIGWDLL